MLSVTPTNLLVTIKGLPLTYNRDLQEDKPPVFDSLDQLGQSLAVVAECLNSAEFDREKCLAAASDPLLLATDLADYLVEAGVPLGRHIIWWGDWFHLQKKNLSLQIFPMKMFQRSVNISLVIGGKFLTSRAFAQEKPGMPPVLIK